MAQIHSYRISYSKTSGAARTRSFRSKRVSQRKENLHASTNKFVIPGNEGIDGANSTRCRLWVCFINHYSRIRSSEVNSIETTHINLRDSRKILVQTYVSPTKWSMIQSNANSRSRITPSSVIRESGPITQSQALNTGNNPRVRTTKTWSVVQYDSFLFLRFFPGSESDYVLLLLHQTEITRRKLRCPQAQNARSK